MPSSTAPAPPPLPRLDHPDPLIQAWADALVRTLQAELQRLATPAGQTGYTVTGASPSRSFNPTNATTAQLGQVVAALVTDLKAKGVIA